MPLSDKRDSIEDGTEGKYDPRNTLNDLTGREWIKFTRSWFVLDSKRYHQNRATEMHPARYPEELVNEFVQYFTKAGQWVFDPFSGSGATLVSCCETGRNGVGVELSPKYAEVARERLQQQAMFSRSFVVEGDARDAGRSTFWEEDIPGLGLGKAGLPQFDFIMTSPPYWNVLHTSRGGVESTHKKREKAGLDTHYSGDDLDLGNIADYDEFIEALGGVFDGLHDLLKPGKYMTVVVQNVRDPEGVLRPIAWDLARRVSDSFAFQGERVWCQNSKMLGIWGYPRVFVPNYHHHYCLIFRSDPS